jgi:hypothetical protein
MDDTVFMIYLAFSSFLKSLSFGLYDDGVIEVLGVFRKHLIGYYSFVPILIGTFMGFVAVFTSFYLASKYLLRYYPNIKGRSIEMAENFIKNKKWVFVSCYLMGIFSYTSFIMHKIPVTWIAYLSTSSLCVICGYISYYVRISSFKNLFGMSVLISIIDITIAYVIK